MTRYDWYLTGDVDAFLARAGAFLRSRPAAHTVPLTVTENLRSHGAGAYGDARPEFGVLEGPAGRDGTRAVRAAYIRTPPYPGVLTALTEQEADALARLLAACHDGTRGTAPDDARPPLTTAPDGARPPLTTAPDGARPP